MTSSADILLTNAIVLTRRDRSNPVVKRQPE